MLMRPNRLDLDLGVIKHEMDQGNSRCLSKNVAVEENRV